MLLIVLLILCPVMSLSRFHLLHTLFSTIVLPFACFCSLSLLLLKVNPKCTVPVLVTRPCGFVRSPENVLKSLQNFQTKVQPRPVRKSIHPQLKINLLGIRFMECHLQSTHSRLATAHYIAGHKRYWNSLLALCYRQIHLFGSRPDVMELYVPLHTFSFSS